MCGICGIAGSTEAPVHQETLSAMVETLHHRGPDDRGTYLGPGIALGHARLSIIDLTKAGHQPLAGVGAATTIVYNGEVYNFRELRSELEEHGVQFRTRTDTEVVLQAYNAWGAAAFARLNGMFAFAIWDEAKRELILARDRFGIKPLYYAEIDGALIFASEIKAILASGRTYPKLNTAALGEYLYYGNTLGTQTLFAGIHKMEAGSYLRFGTSGTEIDRFWRIEDVQPVEAGHREAADMVRDRIEGAVRRHLISDVPVGVFLSGGVDSSTITAFASREVDRLQTYSVDFDFHDGESELPKARMVAETYHTDHHELHIRGVSLPTVIDELVGAHDLPFGDAANIPLYLLSKELNGSPKVILQGDGGDEIFAGYRRYSTLAHLPLWRLLGPWARWINELTPEDAGFYRRRRYLSAVLEKNSAVRMALLLTVEAQAVRPTRILGDGLREIVESSDSFERYRTIDGRLGQTDVVQKMLHTDTSIILPDIFCEKVDRSTMANSIEVRVPLLDLELTELVLGLPAPMKVRRGRKKWLMRSALRGIVPDAILDGPKTGFSVPYGAWLRKSLEPFMRSVLLGVSPLNREVFDREEIAKCIDEHVSGRRDHGFLLWKTLNLALWLEKYQPKISN